MIRNYRIKKYADAGSTIIWSRDSNTSTSFESAFALLAVNFIQCFIHKYDHFQFLLIKLFEPYFFQSSDMHPTGSQDLRNYTRRCTDNVMIVKLHVKQTYWGNCENTPSSRINSIISVVDR